MTLILNSVMAIILRYLAEFGSFRGQLRKKWLISQGRNATHRLSKISGYATDLKIVFKEQRTLPALRTMKINSISWRMKSEMMTKLMAVMWIRRLIFDWQ